MKRIGLITLVVVLSTFVITADAYGIPNRTPQTSHDVAITNMSAPSSCFQGDIVPVVVKVTNQGNCSESFVIKLIDVTNGLKIGSKSLTLSAPGKGGIDEVADLIFTGESPGVQHFGNFLFHGDVNGDGCDDLLVTASRYNNCQGRVYLYYGGKNMDDKPDKAFTGENPGDYFGEGAFLCDLNNDNYDEVLVGSCGYNSKQGRVYIFYGGSNMDTSPDLILDGEETQSKFGGRITAGDVNSDNYNDLIVSAWEYQSYKGRVYLYYGGSTFDTTVDKTFTGENINDTFGYWITVRGDVDGDNYSDLLVGTLNWPDHINRDQAYLFYGAPGTDMDEVCDVTFDAENYRDEFALSIDLFDVDSDGYADVLIGARRWPAGGLQGRAYLYWGSSRATMNNVADKIFTGEPGAAACLGGNAIYAGYVNNDNYGDICIAGYNYYRSDKRGRIYLYYGNTKTLMDETCDQTFTNSADNTGSRWQYLALGDFKGDTYDDMVVGGWGYNNFQGRVWLYYNAPPSSVDVNFDWDTTKHSTVEHTLKAAINPVTGEEDKADNRKTIKVNVKSKVKEK